MLENKRQFFAERDALKQGLSVVKEDEEKPATEKESIFKGESVYVKMLDQVVDLFEEDMDDKPNSKKKTKIELDFHQKFEILPNTNSDKRDVMYIAGASGSDKNEDKAVQDLIDQVSSMGRLHHKKKDEDGLERKEISNLKKMGSRWVNIPLKSFIKLRF
eukprot:jgi/Bigna1/82616/fgenesh1_pg.94_\